MFHNINKLEKEKKTNSPEQKLSVPLLVRHAETPERSTENWLSTKLVSEQKR